MKPVIQTPEWVKDAVFYQIFPDRFERSAASPGLAYLEPWASPPTPDGFKGGDLVGVLEHLDDLKDLGITAIYLNPIFQSASNHRYHTHDYFRVDPLLGGDEALRKLLDAAHAGGIRVVLDGVFNHCGRGFFPFNHVLECGASSPYRDWFTIHDLPLNAYDYSQAPNYNAWQKLHALPELNTANPAVRGFILEVAKHWIEFGIDGWRLDAPERIDHEFWREFRRETKALDADTYIVGEIWTDATAWLQGDEFDAVTNYALTLACAAFFGGQTHPLPLGGGYPSLAPLDARGFAAAVERMLSQYDWEVTTVQLSPLSSHDTSRFLSRVEGDIPALKMATLFQMTVPGAPLVYYGDEIGLTGTYDIESRAAMPWDRSQWNTGLYDFVRAAIRLRNEHTALRRGAYKTLLAEGKRFAFERKDESEHLIVAFNTATTDTTLRVPIESAPGQAKVLLGPAETALADGVVTVEVGPRSGVVVALE